MRDRHEKQNSPIGYAVAGFVTLIGSIVMITVLSLLPVHCQPNETVGMVFLGLFLSGPLAGVVFGLKARKLVAGKLLILFSLTLIALLVWAVLGVEPAVNQTSSEGCIPV